MRMSGQQCERFQFLIQHDYYLGILLLLFITQHGRERGGRSRKEAISGRQIQWGRSEGHAR